MNWLHYLLEANLYLAVFYAGYCLFLNKETHYTLNRVYLLLSCIISFILPVIQIGALKSADQTAQQTYVTITPVASKTATQAAVNYKAEVSHPTLQDAIWYVYLAGIAVLSLLLIIKIGRLIKMTANSKTFAGDQYKLVGLNDSDAAFSFFNYLFIGTKTAGSELIIQHELVHIRQKHSADILFIELLRIINWFNPIIYLLQVSVKTVHEYIADEQTAAQGTDALAYSSFLVDNAYGLNSSTITHSFFNYNLLKKRIIMLNQKRSGNLARLKYLVAVPICGGLLCASTLAFSKNYALVDLSPTHQLFTQKPLKVGTLDANDKGTAPQQHLNLEKFPPPIVIKDGYYSLFYHINKHIKYPQNELKANISGLVAVSFDIDAKGKMSDISIIKSSQREVFNQQALQALKSYSGTVRETAGTHKMVIYFCTDYYKFIKTSEADELKKSDYDQTFMVYKTKPQLENPANADKKAALAPPPVQINDATKLPPPPPPAAPAQDAAIQKSTIPDLSEFYKYMGKHVRYPAIDHDNHIGGRVIATFDIVDGKIIDPTIVRSVEPVIDGELLRVLKAYDGSLKLAPGHYSMPVSFQVIDSKNKQVGHLPENYTNATQQSTADKSAKKSNSFSTSLMLDEVVVTSYTKD